MVSFDPKRSRLTHTKKLSSFEEQFLRNLPKTTKNGCFSRFSGWRKAILTWSALYKVVHFGATEHSKELNYRSQKQKLSPETLKVAILAPLKSRWRCVLRDSSLRQDILPITSRGYDILWLFVIGGCPGASEQFFWNFKNISRKVPFWPS